MCTKRKGRHVSFFDNERIAVKKVISSLQEGEMSALSLHNRKLQLKHLTYFKPIFRIFITIMRGMARGMDVRREKRMMAVKRGWGGKGDVKRRERKYDA